ncbi:MAG: TOBE domain-containing protein [Roseiflexus sp.]|nr:TOBE domain-containing protein [Roseiflexus sp.]MCS7287968.1 TOBE domain-containing protein [Roseiflexus sp.]MDW8233529.1 TOBE domain-containing protein [Roseiflexaceae bacterium]
MRLSARNQLAGTIQSIKEGAVLAEVVVRLAGGDEIVSVITVESVRSLDLKVGDQVKAIIKSTDVMIGLDTDQ